MQEEHAVKTPDDSVPAVDDEALLSSDLKVLRKVGYNDTVVQEYADWIRSLSAAERDSVEPIDNWAVERLRGHLGHCSSDSMEERLAMFTQESRRDILKCYENHGYDLLDNIAIDWVYHRCHKPSKEFKAIFRSVKAGQWSSHSIAARK